MVEPWASVVFGGSACSQRRDSGLGNDGTNFSRSGRDTVGGGPVARGKAFSRDDERCGVGTPIEEKLNENVDGQHTVGANVLVGEAPDDEQNSEEDEADQLKGLAAHCVDGGNCEPVTRDGTSADENAVTGGKIEELAVDGSTAAVADCLENGSGVQAKTIEGDIE